MRAPNLLYIVEGGDHSLRVTKQQLLADGKTQDDVDLRILEAIRKFVQNVTLKRTFPLSEPKRRTD
jgi:hypothetical protein